MATPAENERPDTLTLGRVMHELAAELYPICRSISGNGLRQTLRRLQALIPLTLHEVPSGTPVFDWTVPKEWNIEDAWIKDPTGRKVVDFREHNLHVVSYSVPLRERMPLERLQQHLHSLPQHPDWIPYRTSYYRETWGFCLAERVRSQLSPGEYEVCIDARLEPGQMTYGECFLPGETEREVLISCHACHPSLANDNLSGIVLAAHLARHLQSASRRHGFRFLFLPGTIGSIAWLARNEDRTARIAHGLVVACVGDGGHLTYKKSRRGDAAIDRAVMNVLDHSGQEYEILEFTPYGYDERQYCSPAFDLPVGSLTRTPHGRYPEYHTSADDLQLIRPAALGETFETYLRVLEILEQDRSFLNTCPKGEPQLGKRGLYGSVGGYPDPGRVQMAMLWVLNLSDGRHSLLDIAERAGLEFAVVREAARLLERHELLVPAH